MDPLYALPSTAYVQDAQLDSNGSLVIAVHNRNGASSLQRITTAGAVTSLNSPGGNASVAVHPTDPAQIVCAPEGISDGRVWRTTNSGGSWQSKTITVTNGTDGEVWPTMSNLDSYMSTGHIRFDPSSPDRLWFAEGMGVWSCTNLGDADLKFDFRSSGIQELVANAMVDRRVRVGPVTWDRGLWKWNSAGKATLPPSAQNGVFCSAWDVQARPDDPQVMAAVVSNHNNSDQDFGTRLSCITTDGGSTWTRLAGLANGSTPLGLRYGTIAIARGNTDNLVWAPSTGYNANDLALPLRYSLDRGATWQTPTVPGMSNEFISGENYLKRRKLIASQVTGGKFYAISTGRATGTTYLLVSANGGAT